MIFPSAVSEVTHTEWNDCTPRTVFWDKTVRRGSHYIPGTAKYHPDGFGDHHLPRPETRWGGLRPGGVAFDVKHKQCVFLEFTRPMDSVSFSHKRD